MRHAQRFLYAFLFLQRQEVSTMHISKKALRVLFILSINNGITNAVPAPVAIQLDSAALDMLQISRSDI